MNLNKYVKRLRKYLEYWGFVIEDVEKDPYLLSVELHIKTSAGVLLYLYINLSINHVSLGRMGETLDKDMNYLFWPVYKPKIIAQLVRATLFVP